MKLKKGYENVFITVMLSAAEQGLFITLKY